MTSDIGDLPGHIQLAVVGSVVVISSVWGVLKFLRPFIDNLNPKNEASKTTDAVIISAALADSKLMSDLKHSIDRLCESQEKGNIIHTMLYEAITRLIQKQ